MAPTNMQVTHSLLRRLDRGIAGHRGPLPEGEKATVNRMLKNAEEQGGRLTRRQIDRLTTLVRRIERRNRRTRGRTRP